MQCLRLGLLFSMALCAADPREEHLRYQVNWPSGLSLGEGQIRTSHDTGQWTLELELEAAVPGFRVMDRYRSKVDGKLCSLQFEKEFEHGAKKGSEKTTFDNGKALRQSLNGGKSEFEVPECPKDALAYLFHVREEVARGRLPGPQRIYFGGSYDVRLEFAGKETVKVSEAPMDTDHLKVFVTGVASKFQFDLFLARDEQRTPALIRVPFAMGTFAMEWLR